MDEIAFIVLGLIIISWSIVGILIADKYMVYEMALYKRILLIIIGGPLFWAAAGVYGIVQGIKSAMDKFFIGE